MKKITLTEKENEILIKTLEKQLTLLHSNDIETAKSLLIYLRNLPCDSCGGLGYIEYETGVHYDGVDETMKEPCECEETLSEIKKEREHVPDFMYIQSLEDYCKKCEKEIKHYEKALKHISEGKSSSGMDVGRLWLMGIAEKTLKNSQTDI